MVDLVRDESGQTAVEGGDVDGAGDVVEGEAARRLWGVGGTPVFIEIAQRSWWRLADNCPCWAMSASCGIFAIRHSTEDGGESIQADVQRAQESRRFSQGSDDPTRAHLAFWTVDSESPRPV